jgi:hypothetical protein
MFTTGSSGLRSVAASASQAEIEGRYLDGRPPYGYRLVDAGPHPNPALTRRRLAPAQARAAPGLRPGGQKDLPEAAQTIRAESGRGRDTRERVRMRRDCVLRGLLHCGLRGRKIQAQHNGDRTFYRCRYAQEYALVNHVKHPLNSYVQERHVLPYSTTGSPSSSPRTASTRRCGSSPCTRSLSRSQR